MNKKRTPGIPVSTPSPAEVRAAVAQIGRHRVLSALGIHPSTLHRWETSGRIPRPEWLLLSLWSDGRLPDMPPEWKDFRFINGRLCIAGTRAAFSAREIMGWPYVLAHRDSLARKVQELEARCRHLVSIGDFGAANDAARV